MKCFTQGACAWSTWPLTGETVASPTSRRLPRPEQLTTISNDGCSSHRSSILLVSSRPPLPFILGKRDWGELWQTPLTHFPEMKNDWNNRLPGTLRVLLFAPQSGSALGQRRPLRLIFGNPKQRKSIVSRSCNVPQSSSILMQNKYQIGLCFKPQTFPVQRLLPPSAATRC